MYEDQVDFEDEPSHSSIFKTEEEMREKSFVTPRIDIMANSFIISAKGLHEGNSVTLRCGMNAKSDDSCKASHVRSDESMMKMKAKSKGMKAKKNPQNC